MSVVRPMGTAAYGGKGQGKGKGRGEGRLGQGGKRSKGGEKPMGTTAYGGKGSEGRAANGDRPVGAASCRRDHHTMASSHHAKPPRGGGGASGGLCLCVLIGGLQAPAPLSNILCLATPRLPPCEPSGNGPCSSIPGHPTAD